MLVEAAMIAPLLALQGVAALRVFVDYLNDAVFLVLFEPPQVGSRSLPVPVLEVVVVLIDEAVIKLVVALNPSPGDDYRGVGRGRSLFPSDIVDRVDVVDDAAPPPFLRPPRSKRAPQASTAPRWSML